MLSYVVSKDHSKPVLWLNFDETAVAWSPEALRGCVVSRKEWKGQVKGPHRKVRKDRQRGKYTYCATICDNSAVQAVLPQFLIGKSTHLPKKLVKAFHALPSTQLQLLREKSSWVTSETMLQMLKELKQALLPFLGTMRPILLLDCANAHLAKPVIQGAKKMGIQLLFIPASATSLVQPADVMVFAAFKVYLRKKYQEHRSTAAEGQPATLGWLWQLKESPREFFAARRWKKAFTSIGASRKVSDLHSQLATFMHDIDVCQPSAKPTKAEVSRIWPAKRKMDFAYASLF